MWFALGFIAGATGVIFAMSLAALVWIVRHPFIR
jgi:hypothetical protein